MWINGAEVDRRIYFPFSTLEKEKGQAFSPLQIHCFKCTSSNGGAYGQNQVSKV